jgi:hypothetical protein
MTDSEKIDFLSGQIHALTGLAFAAIKAHHDLAKLAWHLNHVGEITPIFQATPIYSDGIKDIQDQLKRGIEISLGTKTV